jgi:hypothetical protein
MVERINSERREILPNRIVPLENPVFTLLGEFIQHFDVINRHCFNVRHMSSVMSGGGGI